MPCTCLVPYMHTYIHTYLLMSLFIHCITLLYLCCSAAHLLSTSHCTQTWWRKLIGRLLWLTVMKSWRGHLVVCWPQCCSRHPVKTLQWETRYFMYYGSQNGTYIPLPTNHYVGLPLCWKACSENHTPCQQQLYVVCSCGSPQVCMPQQPNSFHASDYFIHLLCNSVSSFNALVAALFSLTFVT